MTNRAPSYQLDLYANLMTEIKIRMRAINSASINQQLSVKGGPLAQEFCFLQLRMICELIALGCLVAHGDIRQTHTNKLEKEYAADRILNILSKLHPHFYPTPARRIDDGKNGSPHIEATHDKDCLSQSELPLLYARCGQALHRGSMKRILSAREPERFNYPEINKWTTKIVSLLDMHIIVLHDLESIVGCSMGPGTDPVQVFAAVAK